MTYRLAMLAASGSLALGTAAAQDDPQGYYGAVGVGYAFENEDNDFQSETRDAGSIDAQEFSSDLNTAGGVAAYGALGKYLPRGFRTEIELSYRNQDVTDITGDELGFRGFPTGSNGENPEDGNPDLGDIGVTALMLNLIKDFNLGASGRIKPYIGAGVGIALVRGEFDNVDRQSAITDRELGDLDRSDRIDPRVGYRIFVDEQDYASAAQGLAGISFEATRNLTVNLGYRYLQTAYYEFGSDTYVNNERTDVDGDFRTHEATIGLRWNFGARTAAAPAPAPTPVQQETRTCLDGTVVPVDQPCPQVEEDRLTPAELRTVVYFDFDAASLTPAARQLLQRRAEEASTVEIVEILISGNTDTAGSSAYNERLSARRAQAVRDALVGYGMSASNIRVRALGETNLAKPTEDGVREPLNRRTEVEFDF